jgi:hypothetical protein
MDPYLEDPALWGDVHHTLISALRRQLNRNLPEGYIALIQERIYLETREGSQQCVPDVSVGVSNREVRSQSATAAVADAPVHIALHAEPVREPYIEIYSLHAPERTLVTVIEILSPANKSPHSQGRRLYLQKQQDLLYSTVHLLEIDLLHEGAHKAFLPLEALKRVRAEWDYLVCLHRAGWAGARRMCGSSTLPSHCRQCLCRCVRPTPMLWYTCKRRSKKRTARGNTTGRQTTRSRRLFPCPLKNWRGRIRSCARKA